MVGIYLAIAYLIGGLWSVLVYARSAHKEGCALHFRAWIELAAIAFFLWPLIALQMFSSLIRNRERRAEARARGRV